MFNQAIYVGGVVMMLTALDAGASPWDLSVNFGIAQYQMNSSSYQSTTTETDNLRQTNNPWVNELGVGLAHVIPSTNLWLGVYYRHLSHDVFRRYTTGQVEQYQEPQMNNYTYSLSATNNRVMVDLTAPVSLSSKISIFAMGGIGYGRTSLKYKDIPNAGISEGNLFLNTSYKSAFISEVGAGLDYQCTNNLKFSLQYLYTWLGSMNTSTTGYFASTYATIIAPARFSLNTHSVLIGLHAAI